MEVKEHTWTKEEKAEILRQYKLCSSPILAGRKESEKNYSSRDPFQRDYARVLYSPSFRRLQGKMQILGVNSAAFYRNRLTHSLEVCQIARSIAYDLSKACTDGSMYYTSKNGNYDLACLEAAALCHDIGHPAFGHSGERALDEIAKRYGMRFEGNAQNFRVLRTLDKYDPEWKGLNLTYRTLLAINKYLVKEDNAVEKFMYTDDFEQLRAIREEAGLLDQRTLDVQIIEIADDIAYAVHDLEDALAYRSFNIDELFYTMEVERERLSEPRKKRFTDKALETSFNTFRDIIAEAREYAGKSNSYNTLQEYSQVFRKRLCSHLTNHLVKNVTLQTVSEAEAKLHGSKSNKELCLGELRPLCKLLKDAIFKCATRDEEIALYEKRGKIVITSLFEAFTNQQINTDGMLLPPDYRDDNESSKANIRSVMDFIAGMMDTFAIEKYMELFGRKFEEIPVDNDRGMLHSDGDGEKDMMIQAG